MYINQRNKVLDVLQTVKEALMYMNSSSYDLLYDCQIGINTIIQYLANESDPHEMHQLKRLKKHIDDLFLTFSSQINSEGQIKNICDFIDSIIQSLYEKKCKYKALFLPYNAAMWNSMSSIYRQAQKDPNCEVTVLPIPYFNIGNIDGVIEMYEENKMPSDVKITHYTKYDISLEMPEMAFIHNPYDNGNNLTTIHPNFYSSELKKHVKCLVYTPYYTVSSYTCNKSEQFYNAPALQNADVIVAQSPEVGKIYENIGFHKKSIMTYGSSKIDEIVYQLSRERQLPKSWKEKLEGKIVFLLNTHLMYFPTAYNLTGKLNNYAVKYHRELLDIFINSECISLIWRPHPLMSMMLKNRYSQYAEIVNEIESKIENSSNCIVDKNGDYMDAFCYSDAMISSYSSLVNEYMVTGKPIFIFQNQRKMENSIMLLNRNLNYFKFGDDKLTFQEFVEMVKAGEDKSKELREKEVIRAFPNCMYGDAGEKIYNDLIWKITNER